MAKKQTRRTLSISRALYEATVQEATRRNMSAAQLVDQALRLAGVEAPPSTHMRLADVERMKASRASGEKVKRKSVPKSKRLVPPTLTGARRPSLERVLLGDNIADKLGFQ